MLLLVGVLLHLNDGSILAAALAGGVIFAFTFLCWWAGWLGGGDVKLLSALTFALAPHGTVDLLVCTSLWGGVLSLIYLALPRFVPAPAALRPVGLMRRALRAEQWRIRRRGPLPYGCAIALGGLTMMASG